MFSVLKNEKKGGGLFLLIVKKTNFNLDQEWQRGQV